MHNRTRDVAGASRHLQLLQGKTQTRGAGDQGRRSRAVAKLKDTLTNDTLGDKADPVTFSAAQVSRAGAVLRDRAEEPRRRGQDQHVDAPARGRGSVDPLQPRSADQGAAALGPGTAAHRGHRREAEAPIRRGREPQAAAHSVPRDDQGLDRGARPPQEADRRPRPVRRLQDQGGAARARRRLRVRGRHLRRLDSAPVRSGGREGHPGRADARVPRRLPDGGLPRHGLRRLVSRRRLERALVQARRFARVQGRDDARAPDHPRAGDERRGLRAVGLRRRPDGRSERAARAHRAAWTRAARRRSSRRRCRWRRC